MSEKQTDPTVEWLMYRQAKTLHDLHLGNARKVLVRDLASILFGLTITGIFANGAFENMQEYTDMQDNPAKYIQQEQQKYIKNCTNIYVSAFEADAIDTIKKAFNGHPTKTGKQGNRFHFELQCKQCGHNKMRGKRTGITYRQP